MTTLAEKLIPIVKDKYEAHIEYQTNKTFELEMEQFLISSFSSHFGSGFSSYTPQKADLKRWGKTVQEVADYIESQGFEVEISKGKYLSIGCAQLKEVMTPLFKRTKG